MPRSRRGSRCCWRENTIPAPCSRRPCAAAAGPMCVLVILTPRLNYNHSSCNKLFEYMAAGLPVIASDLPFARAVIEAHRCGLLVSPPTDAAAIAAAIGKILQNPQEAAEMGQRGRAAVEQHYSWQLEEKKLLELYAQVLHG
ncbi:MAG: glycosyltransferase [Proteobacteria bacterium]|nr:glycosyltransferase [Pseudomonadota bacterium]